MNAGTDRHAEPASSRSYSLAHLTVLKATPPELIHLAAEAGYSHVGLRLLPAMPGGEAYLLDDPAMMSATQNALRETGVRVFDIEIIWLRPETSASDFVRFFEAGAALGAKAVLVGGEDPNQARMVSNLAALCDLAAPFGLTINLELMPWTQAPNLEVATKVLHEVDRPNAGLLVDALHFHRSRSSVERLRDVPRRWFNYLQLCDAPPGIPESVDALKQTAREGRLFPGEGVADIRGMLDAAPPDLPISLEIPNKALAQTMTDLERVRRALDATRRIAMATASSE